MSTFSTFRLPSKVFINVTPDNRVHIWDINTKKEKRVYVERNHQENRYTCHASWVPATPVDNDLGQFAVGTSDGTIIIWDLMRGVVAKTLGVAKESPAPTDITFSNDGKSILVSSSQPFVTQYDVASGAIRNTFKIGKKGALKIALNPKANVLAVASSSVKLIDLDSGEKKKLSSSLAGGAVALAFSSCGKYLAAAGSAGREVLLFKITSSTDNNSSDNNSSKGDLEPVAVFPVHEPIEQLQMQSSKHTVDVLCVLGTTGSGAVVGRFHKNSSNSHSSNNNSNSGASVCVVRCSQAILGGCFGSISSNSAPTLTLTLAVGSSVAPLFYAVDVTDADGGRQLSSEVEVVVTAASASVGSLETAQSHSSSSAVVLGPADVSGVKRPALPTSVSADEDDNDSSSKKKSKTHELGQFELAVDVDATAQTLEQRLESLSAAMTAIETASEHKATKTANASKAALLSAIASSGNPGVSQSQQPTSDSLVALVEQALQSGDNALLEQCLTCEAPAVVEQTCRRLPAGRVLALMKKLVAKFEKRPSRGLLLTRWLSGLLRHHTGYLVAVPDLAKQLAGLSQMLEQRLATYARMAALSGRLELLMSQMSQQHQNKGEAEEEDAVVQAAETKPRVVYVEE